MSKVLQLTIAQKMDALSPLCHWTYDWHSKDREEPTEFQRFCRRQWARLYQKYKKERKMSKETLKVKSSPIAIDYRRKHNISKKVFDKTFDKDLKEITEADRKRMLIFLEDIKEELLGSR